VFSISEVDELVLDIPTKTIKGWYNESYYMDRGNPSGYRGMTWEQYGKIHQAFNDVVSGYYPEPKKIAVLGGARGFQAKCFIDKGFTDVVTVDISYWATHNPIEKHLRMVEADAAEMPMFGDKEFDYVVLSDLLEHLSPARVDMTLKEVARVASKFVFANVCKEPIYRINDHDTTHLTVKSKNWWEAKLNEYFTNVKFESVSLPSWFANDTWECFFMEVKK